MKKLNNLTSEELEGLGYVDLAYMILEESKKKMKITDIFKRICEIKGLSDEEYESHIGDFFEMLTTDKKFIMLEKGFWDLNSRHSEKIVIEDDDDFDDVLDDNENDDEEEDNSIDDAYYDEDDVDSDDDDDLKDFVIIEDEDNLN